MNTTLLPNITHFKLFQYQSFHSNQIVLNKSNQLHSIKQTTINYQNKNKPEKNRIPKFRSLTKSLSMLDYSKIPMWLADHIQAFIELLKQMKCIESDIIEKLNHQYKILSTGNDFNTQNLELNIEKEKVKLKRLKLKTLRKEIQTNQLLGESQKGIFLNLQEKLKIMETKVISYLHQKQYLITEKQICDICDSTFDNPKKLKCHKAKCQKSKNKKCVVEKEEMVKIQQKICSQYLNGIQNENIIYIKQEQLEEQKQKNVRQQIELNNKNKIFPQDFTNQRNKTSLLQPQFLYYNLLDYNYNQSNQLRKRFLLQQERQLIEIHDSISPQQIPFYHSQEHETIFIHSRIRTDQILKASPGKTIRF